MTVTAGCLPSLELMAYFNDQDQAPKSAAGFWVGLAEVGKVFFAFLRHG